MLAIYPWDRVTQLSSSLIGFTLETLTRNNVSNINHNPCDDMTTHSHQSAATPHDYEWLTFAIQFLNTISCSRTRLIIISDIRLTAWIGCKSAPVMNRRTSLFQPSWNQDLTEEKKCEWRCQTTFIPLDRRGFRQVNWSISLPGDTYIYCLHHRTRIRDRGSLRIILTHAYRRN